MAETLFLPDPGLARAIAHLAAAGSLDAVVSILRGAARSIVGPDGIAVIRARATRPSTSPRRLSSRSGAAAGSR